MFSFSAVLCCNGHGTMHRIAPLQALIVWSRGSPLSTALVKNVFDGKPQGIKEESIFRIRQRTPFAIMQFGIYPLTASDSTERRLKQEKLDYFEDASDEAHSEFFRYIDWRCGRQMCFEERRSEILLSLSSMRNSRKDRILMCLAKAIPTDTQMNDIDEHGNVVYLTSYHRGKWYKIHDADHVMVEDVNRSHSTNRAYSRRETKLKSHSGHYVARTGKLPLHAPVLECIFYHENRSLRDILHRLAYTTGTQLEHNASWRATNDEISGEIHTCGTQRFSLVGMTKESIEHASRSHSIHPLLISPIKYKQQLDCTSSGTLHTFVLREVALRTICRHESIRTNELAEEIKKRVEILVARGFVNYFPVRIIGGGGVALYEIGVYLLQRDYSKVLRGYLQLEAERHPVSYDHYVQALGSSEDSLPDRLEEWRVAMGAFRDCEDVRKVLQAILSHIKQGYTWEDTASRVVTSISFLEAHASRYLQAFRAYLWNLLANRRLQDDYASEREPSVRPGDIVCAQQKDGAIYIRVRDKREATSYTIDQVTIPVIGEDLVAMNIVNEYSARSEIPEYKAYVKILTELGISTEILGAPDEERRISLHRFSFRPLLGKPEGMVWRLIRDPNSTVALKSDLFCLQEGNTGLMSPFSYNVDENEKLIEATGKHSDNPEEFLDLLKRLRHPSPYNHSPRFANSIQYIQHFNDSVQSIMLPTEIGSKDPLASRRVEFLPYKREDRCTLVLRFRLPPHSSASVLLREICESIRYKNFNEMF